MAAVRPLVLVYQELADVNASAESPTLETLVAGPCYHIRDYPADSSDIKVASYGNKNAPGDLSSGSPLTRPRPNTAALVLTDPPNNMVGAQLDHASLTVHLENVLVELQTGVAGAFSGSAPDENLFTGDSSTDFIAEGIQKGDRLVVTTPAGETSAYQIHELDDANPDTLRTSTNHAGTLSPLAYRIEREVLNADLSSSFITLVDNVITVKGGAAHTLMVNGSPVAAPINYADMFVEYRSLRKDLAMVTEISNANLESVLGIVDERNPLAAGVHVALANTTTIIQAYGVDGDDLNGSLDMTAAYTRMSDQLESRDDIYMMIPLTQNTDVIEKLHQHAVKFSEPEKAKFRTVVANASTLPSIKSIAGPSDAGSAETNALDDSSVLATAAGGLADVRTGDTLVIAKDDGIAGIEGIYTVDAGLTDFTLYSADLASVSTYSDAGSYYVLKGMAGAVNRRVSGTEVTGVDTIEIPELDGKATDVGKVIRLVSSANNAGASPVGNEDFLITAVTTPSSSPAVYTVVGPGLSAEATLVADILDTVAFEVNAAQIDVRNAFRRVLDNNASFITNGVVPGDILQIPLPPVSSGAEFGDVYSAVVVDVISENRIQLVVGSDIPTLAPGAPQIGDLGYRVARSLDKAGQRDALKSIVDPNSGYNSKRLVTIWPDELLLASVQNNKTRTRSRQPGYYLACAVGGMNAGLPPHQGFTFLGVSGVDEIYHSSRYFKEDDLEELSNSGWFLFLQDTVVQNPYCLHQLTTDTSVMENMELSMVRNFDYISRFYKNIIEQFIGRYNVTPQTLDLLRETLNSGTDQLKSNSLPRIGAPLIDATVDVVKALEGARDRVEIYMSVDMPAPLNRIGLHLVA